MFPSGYDSFLQYGAVNTVLISYTYQWIINDICQTSILVLSQNSLASLQQ